MQLLVRLHSGDKILCLWRSELSSIIRTSTTRHFHADAVGEGMRVRALRCFAVYIVQTVINVQCVQKGRAICLVTTLCDLSMAILYLYLYTC